MREPELKRKSIINNIFKNKLFITLSTAFLLIFILIGSSYAVFNTKIETGLTDVVVQSGNLQATISSSSDMIQMNYTTLGVSDVVGMSYEPYTFIVSNSSENKIAYYELRIVDKEYEISTLPHKALNYSISINGSEYTEPKNLGDNRSYIYTGGSLDEGDSDTFNIKLWVNEEFGKYANNKEIKASIELTLYSDIPTRNYIIYDTQGGNYIPKTSVVSKRVTNQIPIKAGYEFAGWSTSENGEVEYESNAIYNETNGITLYAIWQVPAQPPVCVFLENDSYSVSYDDSCDPITYYLECTSAASFVDSEIASSDIVFSENSSIQVLSISKTSIANGYRYEIYILGNGKIGDTLVSLAANSVSNIQGLGNGLTNGHTWSITGDPCEGFIPLG